MLDKSKYFIASWLITKWSPTFFCYQWALFLTFIHYLTSQSFYFFFCFVNVLIGFKITFYFLILFGKGSCLQYSCLISSSEKSFRKTKILNFSVRSRPTHNPGIYFASIPHLLWPLVITKLITVAHQNREKKMHPKIY